jgi:hypothetical protein
LVGWYSDVLWLQPIAWGLVSFVNTFDFIRSDGIIFN